MFGYSINPNNNKFNSGWIYQIKNSFEGKFVLENSSFTTEIKELGSKFNFENYIRMTMNLIGKMVV